MFKRQIAHLEVARFGVVRNLLRWALSRLVTVVLALVTDYDVSSL